MAFLRIGIATLAILICLGKHFTASKSLISNEVVNIHYAEGITRVIINVGSHDNPPMPDNTTLVVAVEPLPEVAAKIPPAENRYVLTAAIAGVCSCLHLKTFLSRALYILRWTCYGMLLVPDYYGIATFHHWMDSSSLLETNPKHDATHKEKGLKGQKILVPVLVWFLPIPACLYSIK